MNLLKYIFAVCFFVSVVQTSHAQFGAPVNSAGIVSECDYCGCAQGISPLQTGSTGIRYDIGSLYLNAPYNGSEKQPNPGNNTESFLTNKLTLFYRFSGSPFTASLSIPYVNRQSEELGDNGGIQSASGNGIGDIAAFIRYNHKHYLDEATIAFSFSAGVKFPTGKDNVTIVNGGYLDPDLQPGTGTADIIFGTAGFWSMDKLGVFGSLNIGLITGSGAPEVDDAGKSIGNHKYGNYLVAEITGTYRLIPQEASLSNLSASFGVGLDARDKESQGGVPIINSGGYILYALPGLKAIISQNMAADFSVQVPIHQYLGWNPVTGENQLGQSYRILFGVQYSVL